MAVRSAGLTANGGKSGVTMFPAAGAGVFIGRCLFFKFLENSFLSTNRLYPWKRAKLPDFS